MSRRQSKPSQNLKKVNILEFGDYIWNHHEKFIQISTNMPGISLEICEILRILRNKTIFVWMVKPMAACVQSINIPEIQYTNSLIVYYVS